MKSIVTVEKLAEKLHLKPLHGLEYLDREITTSEISRPGLELAGYFNFYPAERIQLLGRTELSFAEQLSSRTRLKTMRRLCTPDTPCFVVSRKLLPPEELIEAAEEAKSEFKNDSCIE